MRKNLKYFLLKLLPYVISIAIGLTIFAIVRRIERRDEDVSNLLINISSDLLSIPFVFICYEVVNKIINQDLDNTLFRSTTFNINLIIINMVNDMGNIIGYTNIINKNNIGEFLKLSKKDILKKLKNNKLSKDILDNISENNKNLYNVMHQSTTIEVLDGDQIKNLLYLSREINILYNKFSILLNKPIDAKEKTLIAENFENIIDSIKSWMDTSEIDALIKHQGIRIIWLLIKKLLILVIIVKTSFRYRIITEKTYLIFTINKKLLII